MAEDNQAEANNQPYLPLSQKDKGRVCRATVAAEMNRSPDAISVSQKPGDTVTVSYRRPEDGKKWTNECRFQGNRVIWRTVDAFGEGSGAGRWRDGPDDILYNFALEGAIVTITATYADRSETKFKYTL